jgi:hypothetical protein
VTSSGKCQVKSDLFLSVRIVPRSGRANVTLLLHCHTHSNDTLDTLYSDLLMLYWRITLWLLSRKYLLHFQFHSNNVLSRIFTLYKLHSYTSFPLTIITVYTLKNLEFFFGGAQILTSERFESQAQIIFFWNWDALTQLANRASRFPQGAYPYTFLIGLLQNYHANLALKTQTTTFLTGLWLMLAQAWIYDPPTLNLLPDFSLKYRISKTIP